MTQTEHVSLNFLPHLASHRSARLHASATRRSLRGAADEMEVLRTWHRLKTAPQPYQLNEGEHLKVT